MSFLLSLCIHLMASAQSHGFFSSQRHVVPFSPLVLMLVVGGMSSAADSAVCMEMNQLLILQPVEGGLGAWLEPPFPGSVSPHQATQSPRLRCVSQIAFAVTYHC